MDALYKSTFTLLYLQCTWSCVDGVGRSVTRRIQLSRNLLCNRVLSTWTVVLPGHEAACLSQLWSYLWLNLEHSKSSSHISFPSQKTDDNNQSPEQPIDMRMNKDNKAKA